MFTPRTTPVANGEAPWKWGIASVYQCTWYTYYRAFQALGSYPCWWDRATKAGSYTNAKDWLENYRDPWVVKGPEYTPVAGDIAVFDGAYGHVQFMETDTMYSEYSSGDPNSFRNGKFNKSSNLLGFLHYPVDGVNPVDRNESVDQIECTDPLLRIRNNPSLDADIIGHVQVGFYNVLDKVEGDGYTWYEIAEGKWCANVCINYLPSESTDFIKQIEEWAGNMVNQVKMKDNKIQEMSKDMKDIETITRKWV